jgi:hypothetical protein
MRAEDVKAWLQGIKREEDPETGPANIGAGSHWRLFLSLVQAIWDHGDIPPQLLWVIVILIPKGGGDYRGIGLLEPTWKVCKRVMDKLTCLTYTKVSTAAAQDTELAQPE